MTSRTSAGPKAAKKKAATTVAAKKAVKQKPKKSAGKPTKKAAPAQKSAKPAKPIKPVKAAKQAAKPKAKAAPEKKPVAQAKAKTSQPTVAPKKTPATTASEPQKKLLKTPTAAKSNEPKSAEGAAKAPIAKKAMSQKIVEKDAAAPAKKPAPLESKSGASSASTSGSNTTAAKASATAAKASATAAKASAAATKAAASVSAPLKVEPKIIETSQIEAKKPIIEGDLFSADELQMFRALLESERNKILGKAKRAVEEGGIQIERDDLMDEVDQAAAMEAQNLTFRLLDRDRKLLAEIDHALFKIETGDYGYCEGTGEPIPKRRLELRPWCRHSVKYKEKLERMKKSGRGVVDEDEL